MEGFFEGQILLTLLFLVSKINFAKKDENNGNQKFRKLCPSLWVTICDGLSGFLITIFYGWKILRRSLRGLLLLRTFDCHHCAQCSSTWSNSSVQWTVLNHKRFPKRFDSLKPWTKLHEWPQKRWVALIDPISSLSENPVSAFSKTFKLFGKTTSFQPALGIINPLKRLLEEAPGSGFC